MNNFDQKTYFAGRIRALHKCYILKLKVNNAIHNFGTIDCDACKLGPFKLGQVFLFSKTNKR